MKLVNRGAESAPNLNLKGMWCDVDGRAISATAAWPSGQVREFADDDALRVVAICGPAIKLVDEPKPKRSRKKKEEEPAAEVANEPATDEASE